MNTSTLLKKANRLLIKKANELLKPHGITHAYTYFLMELYQQDGLTQSEMHKRIGIEQPTAVRTLDRMERDGLILREQSPTDRRALFIKLTDKGKRYKEIILGCAKELNDFSLRGFTDNDRALFNQLINRLNSNLDS
ncbi:TPA: MarR family transcriptional regulator [Legionella pneumophila]|uniref:MarR family transcriptional regulator n=1 Tax=Legionella lytica TaxID=96232 RepID=A0ABY4YC63_9GAMM|nr:MarR family transcriptional regulator [Legionella lytica]USQ15243.1 MarR family transcriptional regulator [Legionella lytica]USQ15604.1 MarR family transcriptional regulator [Legionella lytica]HAU0368119.1 MarR family transcriptional regulator [Legionella pneumophila]